MSTISRLHIPYDVECPFGTYQLTKRHEFIYSLFRKRWLPRGSFFNNFLRYSAGQYPQGIMDASIDGISLRMKPVFSVSERAVLRKGLRYDYKERSALENACNSAEGSVFIDIGANVGVHSLFLVKACPKARVLAFEPHPGTCEQLKFNVELNNAFDIAVYQKAISDHNGLVKMKSYDEIAITQIDSEGEIEVECTPLIDVVGENNLTKIDAIKVDVEGHEDRVLVPFLQNIPDSLLPTVIVVEVCNSSFWSESPVEVALSRGFKEIKCNKMNSILLRNS